MKYFIIASILFVCVSSYGQSLPIDFENDVTTADFVDFDGGTATVIPNPNMSGINTSNTVAQIVRDGGAMWAGSKIKLDANLDFSSLNVISLKVFTTAPAGTQVKFKLEGMGAVERDNWTTVSGQWETLTWDFTGTPNEFDEIVFMFDFGNVGDGSINSTFLFDDVELLFGGWQIDLPVDFEDPETNYTLTDFEGASSMLVIDPTNEFNNVAKAVKGAGAGASSGTTIGTPAGFATNIPLTLTDSKMTVRVWSPEANTPIRLKVEDSNDPTHTCETETRTTMSGDWETLVFDFLNQAPGTELLSVGLSMGWTYNKASIFFNFGTEGTSANEKTYFFDDVKFGGSTTGINNISAIDIQVFPNPASDRWTILSEGNNISQVSLFDVNGMLLSIHNLSSNVKSIDCQSLLSGIYFAKIATQQGIKLVKLIKE